MNMTPLKAAEATRLKLREAGYSPIPVEGKIPRFNEWEKLAGATEEDITSWTVTRPTFTNTGGRTARMPTVDIDIKNPEAAEAAEQLVRDRFGDTGRVLVRVGNAPKRAIPFQTAKPFPKISVNFVSSDGKTDQKIEFLCNGQQVVVDGVHPDTHRPYTWFGGIPGEVRLVDLPCINEAEAKTLVRDLAELLVAEHGYKLAPSRPKTANGANSHNGADQAIEIRGDDWSHLVGNILDGAELHDSLRDLAAKLVTAGVGGGAAVNIVRGVMSRSQAPRDERYHDRFAEIPRLVSSAEQKFAGPHITNNGEFRAPWTPETENSSPPFEENITAAFTVVGDAPAAPPRELIKGLLPPYGIAVTGGQSTAGKTFIQIHKSICLATGLPYSGHRIVERVGTAFVAAEGRALIPNRFAAGLAKALITDRLPIAWIKQLPDFSSTEGIKIFVRQLKALDERFRGDFGVRLGHLPIDTVAACFAMKSEDDNAEATKIANIMRSIGEETGALAAPVHHYGKNPESGLRGASAWKGSADIVEGVLADVDPLSGRTSNRELVCTKARDGEQGPLSPFELKFIKLGIDADGEDYGSCCVIPAEGNTRFDKAAKPSKGQRAVLEAINEAMDSRAKVITPRAGMAAVKAVKVTEVREEFDRRYVVGEADPDKAANAKRMAFKRALDNLPTAQFGAGSAEGADWIWRAT